MLPPFTGQIQKKKRALHSPGKLGETKSPRWCRQNIDYAIPHVRECAAAQFAQRRFALDTYVVYEARKLSPIHAACAMQRKSSGKRDTLQTAGLNEVTYCSCLVVGYAHAHSQRTKATTTRVYSTSKTPATAVNQSCVLDTSLKSRRGFRPTRRQHRKGQRLRNVRSRPPR